METLILGIIGFLCFWIYVSFNWRSWKTNLEIWQLKRTKKIKITKNKSYKSVDELLEDLNKRDIWYKELFLILRVRIEQFFDIPRDVYRFFKRGIQRWSRGWADEDVWSINGFLSEIIPQMLKRLKETKQGIPMVVGKMSNDEEVKQAEELWDEILNNIIWTFEISKKIADSELAYFEKWTQTKADKYNKIWVDWKYESKPRAMSKEECRRYENGWKLMKKYFYNLWD
jgi:hypothetical protein